ncbi:MAG: hypothetical protein ACRCXD_09230 [Luteolibacter sp.]
MNSFIKTLAFCALLGASGGANATEVLIENGDFETSPASDDFSNFASPGTIVSYPTSEGNPGGYGQIDNTGGSWGGGLVSPPDNFYPNNSGTPLGDLGLVAGQTYVFKMDMKNFAGTGKGGLKLESWTDTGIISATADVPATGQSSAWTTYSWTYTIEPTATRIKVVPLATPPTGVTTSDIIGFDNIRVDNGVVPPPPVIPGIPNPGFEIPGGASWAFVGNGPSIAYPAAGGNPNGYAVITQPTGVGTFAILIANSDSALTIGPSGQLPLIAGTTATFAMDMRIEAGSAQSNIGGFKVDFVGGPGGSTGDMYPAKSGSGTEWATYTFSVPIPVGVTGIKLVPLWGPNSSVGYDNIRIVDTFAAAIANGFNVSWTANSANRYQPQSSATGAPGSFVNVGSSISGGAGNSIYQAVKAPFYQVLEITPTLLDNTVFNPGFETSDPDMGDPATIGANGAEGWKLAQPVPLGNTVDIVSSYGSIFPNSGSAMMVFDAVQPTSSSEVRSLQFTIEPAKSYDFSFYLSIPVKTGGASLQYSLFYFDEFGALIDPTGNKFTSINTAAIGSAWTKVTQPITTPADAATVTVGFLLPLGADPGIHWVTMFDDVSIDTGMILEPLSTTSVIAATVGSAVEVSWPTAQVPTNTPGRTYQVKSSTDLLTWADFGGPVTGNGAAFSVTDALTPPRKFFRVSEVTP